MENANQNTITIQGTNSFIDISHLDSKVDLYKAREAGLLGFMHKATQHTDFEDPEYGTRRNIGKELGLLVGAYHFATAAPVEQQINFFLGILAKHDPINIVPCLDWEPNPDNTQGTMTKQQVIKFVGILYEEINVYPMLYGGYWMLRTLKSDKQPSLLSKCPLWQAFYSNHFEYLNIWKNWTMLQYTDGKTGPEPHVFDGVGNVDRNIFNGTVSDAKQFWKNNSIKEGVTNA